MVGSIYCWLDLDKSPSTIFSLASWFWATIAYCSLFNIAAIVLRPDKYNKVSTTTALTALKKIKKKKSSGGDGLSQEQMVMGAKSLVTPLTNIINQSIKSGINMLSVNQLNAQVKITEIWKALNQSNLLLLLPVDNDEFEKMVQLMTTIDMRLTEAEQ